MATYTLKSNTHCGTGLRWLSFEEPPAQHTQPGQFVAATVDAQQGYYAIASEPGEPLELLIKAVGQPAEALADLAEGDTMDATAAMGNGFPLGQGADRPLICLINGSAMSAARPVIRAELERGLPRPVHLILGVLTPEHIPFGREIRLWAEAGVDVHITLDAPAEGWTGRVGYVQTLAADLGLVHDGVAVLLCGVPPMQEAATAAYEAVGLDPSFILTNF